MIRKITTIAILFGASVFANAQDNTKNLKDGFVFLQNPRPSTEFSINNKIVDVKKGDILNANGFAVKLPKNETLGIALSNGIGIIIEGPADFRIDNLKQTYPILPLISNTYADSISNTKISINSGSFYIASLKKNFSSSFTINAKGVNIKSKNSKLVVRASKDVDIYSLEGSCEAKFGNGITEVLRDGNKISTVSERKLGKSEHIFSIMIKRLSKKMNKAMAIVQSVNFLSTPDNKATVRILLDETRLLR